MSELVTQPQSKNFRWQLLSTASALALVASVAGEALAQDANHPTVWIELGGQLEAVQGQNDPYGARFTYANLNKPHNLVSPLSIQRAPHRSFGGEGKISFEPAGTDWVLSAGIRFGRSNGKRSMHQQTSTQAVQKTAKYGKPRNVFLHPEGGIYNGHVTLPHTRFDNSQVAYSESHAIVDFKVGKDVGLGMFGKAENSVLSLGVRIAQFQTRANVDFKSYPDPHWPTKLGTVANTGNRHHSYFATGRFKHSFRGIGPSIAWEGDATLLGDTDAGVLTFDWGINAAALFGRQKVSGAHETHGIYFKGQGTTTLRSNVPVTRARSVVIPNAGGLAGLSVRYPNAKFSLGYRADFFFGAMDGGIDTRHTHDRSFHGPYAKVSVGLGG